MVNIFDSANFKINPAFVYNLGEIFLLCSAKRGQGGEAPCKQKTLTFFMLADDCNKFYNVGA